MIARLRHKMVLCSQNDVVNDGTLNLRREGVLFTWASVDAKKSSAFSRNGAAVMESRDARTHVICIRYRTDIDITNLAWLYEERRKSPSRWFKILSHSQTEDKGSPMFKFDCRLVERTDEAPSPTSGASNMPGGAINTDVRM